MSDPKWTVAYNTVSWGSHWMGTGWEFFDHLQAAELRAKNIPETEPMINPPYSGPVCATIRPFHESDRVHLGTIHR